nr:hypothetical protein KitaXyl93_78840 [Kitasatospora sp. Xyl93]
MVGPQLSSGRLVGPVRSTDRAGGGSAPPGPGQGEGAAPDGTGEAVRGNGPGSAAGRGADFDGACSDAVDDATDGLGERLRARYLAEDLRRRPADWGRSTMPTACCAPMTFPPAGRCATKTAAPGSCSPRSP